MAKRSTKKAAAKKPAKGTPAALRRFVKAFEADPPPEAAGGMFSPTEANGYAGRTVSVGDGVHRWRDSEWAFEFRGKRLVRAIRREHWAAAGIG